MMLKDKVAVVTGSGRGIGKAIALALAREGARVVVAARTLTEINAVAREIEAVGTAAFPVRTDVSQEFDVNMLVSKTVQKWGAIDILINNAGVGTFAKVVDLAASEFDKMVRVNMRGVFLCARAVVPHMVQKNSGDIVNVASLAGRNAFVGGAAYCATKWGLIGFARCLMLEVRTHNIRVITVCPGSVDTGFGGEKDELAHRSSGDIPQAEDIARVVVDALRMPRNVMVSEVDVRPTNPKH
ncbi:MAG TPA: SDR family NAD(P)-dependent oxidoreductase [Bacteroidota bacterium]|nr:SDR family NAD(P)-dependent oxidoreductase [Bacteroidota bacterium]